MGLHSGRFASSAQRQRYGCRSGRNTAGFWFVGGFPPLRSLIPRTSALRRAAPGPSDELCKVETSLANWPYASPHLGAIEAGFQRRCLLAVASPELRRPTACAFEPNVPPAIIATPEFDGMDDGQDSATLGKVIGAFFQWLVKPTASIRKNLFAEVQPKRDAIWATSPGVTSRPGERPLTIWCVTTGNAGSHSQALGLSSSLSPDVVEKIVRVRWPWSWSPTSLFRLSGARVVHGHPGLNAPWPDVLISCGRRSGLVARAIRRASRGSTLTVHIERPPGPATDFDLVVVLPHDNLRGPNVLVVNTALHRLTDQILREASKLWRPEFRHLPRPWTGVLLGGSTRRRMFTIEHAQRLIDDIEARRSVRAGSLLITPSRRTPRPVIDAIRKYYSDDPTVFIWDGENANPYFAILGLADRILVTSDSISMMSEALATKVPVSVFDLGGGARHRKFLGNLLDRQLVRLSDDHDDAFRISPVDAMKAATRAVKDLIESRARES